MPVNASRPSEAEVWLREPMTLAILPLDLEVLREEQIEINGKKPTTLFGKVHKPTASFAFGYCISVEFK